MSEEQPKVSMLARHARQAETKGGLCCAVCKEALTPIMGGYHAYRWASATLMQTGPAVVVYAHTEHAAAAITMMEKEWAR